MDAEEAVKILEAELETFRGLSYPELTQKVGSGPIVCERQGSSLAAYQLEIEFVWDGPSGGDVRVIGSIDDGGWRAFVPITRSFSQSARDS
jgi:hypothetical protein